jgi:TP53 regulating kinase and related kinases
MGASKLAIEPFHRGAEANLFLSTIHPWKVVVKQRISKFYRNASLDDKIRSERTLSEVSIMHDAKASGVRVPSITGVEPETNTFSMTFVDGTLARDCLDGMNPREATKLFEKLGAMVGRLHCGGIVHGDLTTSNIVVTAEGDPFLVDFGMARRSIDPEDRGVDLHLLQRSIVTSHLKDASPLIKALATGYSKTAGRAINESSWAKAREISRRGRYFAIR